MTPICLKRIIQSTAFAFTIGATIFTSHAVAAEAQQRFPITTLTAGMYMIQAEVAATPDQREQGLMFRKKMAENDGMVFLFGGPAKVCMWMKNTLIPLSVAFLDKNGKVVNIEDMQPQSLTSHCSKEYVPYALEMNLGWFKQKNIKPGSIIKGLPPVESGQRSQ
tara:strand:+ start:518612 stop:519103 length:492 start_codon:yes stop_codon:yes gene_type:complete